MNFAIRRLGAGDQQILSDLATGDGDFDIDGRGYPREPLSHESAREYLADPHVLHWVAEDSSGVILGHMYCHVLRKRKEPPIELLLYEIGVRKNHRRRGVGRALMQAMKDWMEAQRVREAWVLADNAGAVAFYRACGFEAQVSPGAPVYMTIGMAS